MATSPPSNSPTMTNLNNPRKRPSMSGSGPSSSKRRKASQAAGPSHLRETSFPPTDTPHRGSRSPSVDSSVLATTPSVISAPGRKRKGKGARDDGSITGSQTGKARSATGTATAVGGSLINGAGGDDGEDGDDDDIDDAGAMLDGGKMTEAETQQRRKNEEMLLEALTPDQFERYEIWRRVRLQKGTIRKLINHTLSQSVPNAITLTVNGYTKVFISEIIERARDVQLEWQAAATMFPNGEPVPHDMPLKERTKQEHRGPLTPDHMREAMRRFKKDREGGCAGILGLSLLGRESTAPRMGGRKLFR